MPQPKGRSSPSADRLGSIAFWVLPVALATVWGVPVDAQPASVGDRYSGETYTRPAYQPAAPMNGPTLSWPGKTAAVAPPAAQAASASSPQPAPQSPAFDRMRAPAYAAAPVRPWYQRYGAASSPPEPPPESPSASLAGAPTPAAAVSQAFQAPPPMPAPAPTRAPKSIYDMPAVANASAAETVRYYSVHRQYGLTPDPDPIPPQFFTQTADLADPPGPSPIYKAASSSGTAATTAHAVQSDTSTSTLAQP